MGETDGYDKYDVQQIEKVNKGIGNYPPHMDTRLQTQVEHHYVDISGEYKWYDDTSGTYTKYNDTDKKTVLDSEDDAAHILIGGTWKIPAYSDFMRFLNVVKIKLTLANTQDGSIKEIDTQKKYSGTIKLSDYDIDNTNSTYSIKSLEFYGDRLSAPILFPAVPTSDDEYYCICSFSDIVPSSVQACRAFLVRMSNNTIGFNFSKNTVYRCGLYPIRPIMIKS